MVYGSHMKHWWSKNPCANSNPNFRSSVQEEVLSWANLNPVWSPRSLVRKILIKWEGKFWGTTISLKVLHAEEIRLYAKDWWPEPALNYNKLWFWTNTYQPSHQYSEASSAVRRKYSEALLNIQDRINANGFLQTESSPKGKCVNNIKLALGTT